MFMMSSALMRTSVVVQPMPPEGWCISTRAWDVRKRLPLVPELSRNWPIDAHMPMPTVATSGSMSCIVS